MSVKWNSFRVVGKQEVIQAANGWAIISIGAGLLLKSYDRLRSADMGCLTQDVITMHLGLPDARHATPAQRANFYDTLLDRVRTLPGVDAAGFVTAVPGQGYGTDSTFSIVEHPPLPQGSGLFALSRWADPKYFHAMGIPILRGRTFDGGKRLDAANEVIISQSFADQYFPSEDPLGRHLVPAWRASRLDPMQALRVEWADIPAISRRHSQLAQNRRVAHREILRIGTDDRWPRTSRKLGVRKADFSLLIAVSLHQITFVWPSTRTKPDSRTASKNALACFGLCRAVAHSSRSSTIGSIDSARRAGIQVASSPSNDIARATPTNTSGSRGVA